MRDKAPDMVPVPIPTEVPAPPQLDQLPLDILHSATVELLIQQNEDLSSRLKVNIRRNSQLEIKIMEQEKQVRELKKKRENVLAQMEIIKEKETLWMAQKESRERQVAALKKESQLLETRYLELRSMSQHKAREAREKIIEKQKKLEQLQRKLQTHLKIRKRAKDKLRAFLMDLASGMNSHYLAKTKAEASLRLLKRDIQKLELDLGNNQEQSQRSIEQLKEVSQKALQDLDLKLNQTQQENQSFKQERSELKNEISELKSQLHEEKKNRALVSELNIQLSQLKNHQITQKRESESRQTQLEKAYELERKKASLSEKRAERLEREMESQKTSLSACEDKLLHLSKENREISEQLKAVQKLWAESQDKLERSEIQCSSLDKLNRQLAQEKNKNRIKKATQMAHPEQTSSASQKTEEPTATSKKPQDDYQKKLKNLYASQYGRNPGL